MTELISGILIKDPHRVWRIRSIDRSLRPHPQDPKVGPEWIKRLRLCEGAALTARVERRNGRVKIVDVADVAGMAPEAFSKRRPLKSLVALDPVDRLDLGASNDPSMRILDLITPVGKGTRQLIVSPPKAGKTVLLEQILKAVRSGHPDIRTIALLIDERPEEVTQIRRAVEGVDCFTSTSDQTADDHAALAETLLQHLQIELECGRDLVLVIDSLTRIGRAFNNRTTRRSTHRGHTLSGGLEAGVLEIPRRLFGLARNIENGGSVTIFATCLIDTGSRMDQLIFEEFKGTGNSEIVLDRGLAESRIFPAIDIPASGTRKEVKLYDDRRHQGLATLRRVLSQYGKRDAVGSLHKLLARFPTNDAFLDSLSSGELLAPSPDASRECSTQRSPTDMDPQYIRNFSIIAHIDHGKSTLADRMLERTHTIDRRKQREQILDSMDLERERGITIKASAVTMTYQYEGRAHMLNLIDTPGHVDFHYEVSRALAACEGALLVVDATQGVEAQTVANAYLAIETGAELIGVINKIDLPAAQPTVVAEEIEHVVGIRVGECFHISAKTGLGVSELLDAVCELLPPPADRRTEPLQALVFDSHADAYRGVICYVRVFSGQSQHRQKIRFMSNNRTYQISELGKFRPEMTAVPTLGTGEVGYVIANIRNLADVTIGDTITDDASPAAGPLKGYQPPMQMVFSDFYPGNNSDYPALRTAFEKLAINDASFTAAPQSSPALGFGFRCGFLGLLHMEIIQERLERENDIDVVQTAPTVSYEVVTKDGLTRRIDSPSELPDRNHIEEIREPFVSLEIITTSVSIGGIMKLAEDRRCRLLKTDYLNETRVLLAYEAPLAEIVYDFYDQLKGISKGYATMNYDFVGFRPGPLVKIDILVNQSPVDALSLIVHRDKAETRGRRLIQRLRDAIPKHQFEIPLQVAIGGKIIARETIRAYRKDVTAKLYGGNVTRKMKLLKKQKEGKKRMKSIGQVQIPQEAFMSVLEMGS